MSEFSPSDPEREEVKLELPEADLVVDNFTEYSFDSNFLAPTDGWSFTVGAEQLTDEMRQALVPGALVKLTVNAGVQATGYIDSIEYTASRDSGSIMRIEGRDLLAQAADACADPLKKFEEGSTLLDAMRSLLGPFGWPNEDDYVEDNDANRDLKAGGLRGEKKPSDAKGHGRRKLKDHNLHQLKPFPREGVLQFAHRISQRFGLWIWCTASGRQIVVSKPNFETSPFYKLIRNDEGDTNVLDLSVKFDIAEQPTVVIADGFSGGGDFGKGRVKTIMANTAVHTPDPAFLKYYYEYPDARRVDGHAFRNNVRMPRNRALILHDDTSQTQEQLDNFVKREMALLQRKALVVRATVEGHGQLTPDGFVPWTVDTTVDVEDSFSGLRERLYVLGRTFEKSRSGGTTTKLELIRLHTLEF